MNRLERQRLVEAVRGPVHELQLWSVAHTWRYNVSSGEFYSQAGWYRVTIKLTSLHDFYNRVGIFMFSIRVRFEFV